MPRPNSNPGRYSDTQAIVRRGVNSPMPLADDYRMGMAFGPTSPGARPRPNSSPDNTSRNLPGGSYTDNPLCATKAYLNRC